MMNGIQASPYQFSIKPPKKTPKHNIRINWRRHSWIISFRIHNHSLKKKTSLKINWKSTSGSENSTSIRHSTERHMADASSKNVIQATPFISAYCIMHNNSSRLNQLFLTSLNSIPIISSAYVRRSCGSNGDEVEGSAKTQRKQIDVIFAGW